MILDSVSEYSERCVWHKLLSVASPSLFQTLSLSHSYSSLSLSLSLLLLSLSLSHHHKALEVEVWFVVEEVNVVIAVQRGGRGTGKSRELPLLV